MPRSWTFSAVRPYLWLAGSTLAAGVASFLLVGQGPRPATRGAAVYVPAAATPAGSDWNVPKHI
jgi:hypothetical protein